jgi:hypothetical protein
MFSVDRALMWYRLRHEIDKEDIRYRDDEFNRLFKRSLDDEGKC